MPKPQTEVRDVPFLGNDLNNQPPTTGKPLGSADGAGKADAEIASEPDDSTPQPEMDTD